MKEESLQRLIAWDGPAKVDRTEGCLPDETLAAYLDRRLTAADRPAVESHLADCGRCLALVGEHIRSERPRRNHRSGLWRQFPRSAMAAAAAVVLAVTVLLSVNRPQGPVDDMTAVRFSQHTPEVPELSFPAGTEVPLDELEIDWTDVPGHLFYELRIVDEDGDLIWKERVIKPSWRPPADVPLKAGADYFVRVDAYLSDGKPVVSGHIPFRVTERDG